LPGPILGGGSHHVEQVASSGLSRPPEALAMGLNLVLLIFAYLAFFLIFAFGICWWWPEYVDETDPPRVRRWLHTFLAIQVVMELWVYFVGFIKFWTILVVLFCNAWGMFDAFLRYPSCHDIDTLFGLKQVALVTLKLCVYALGFIDIGNRIGWFIFMILTFVFTLPIVWLTALPFGSIGMYNQKMDIVDEDLMYKIYKVLVVPSDRAAAIAYYKTMARHFAVQLTNVAPFLKPVVLKMDPALQKAISKNPTRGV
jgi:hypothetical protein